MGRPKRNRIRGTDEQDKSNKKAKRPHQCTRCGGWGHHRNTCKQPLNNVENLTSIESTIHGDHVGSGSSSSTIPARRKKQTARRRGKTKSTSSANTEGEIGMQQSMTSDAPQVQTPNVVEFPVARAPRGSNMLTEVNLVGGRGGQTGGGRGKQIVCSGRGRLRVTRVV